MSEYRIDEIAERIGLALVDASRHLEAPLVERLRQMREKTGAAAAALPPSDSRRPRYEASLEVLGMILENLRVSSERKLPMCQDTGMVVAFVQIGPDVPLGMMAIGNALETGIGRAVEMGLFRCSVVEDPVFRRTNTLTNLPPVIHWFPTDRPGLQISMMLKGFGSENCSALTMLNPTAGAEGVVSAVADMVAKAGGKPCPPIVVGVGLGGTAERAMLLSKKALLRTTGEPHPNARYARLEQEIEEAVQRLEIGPGGFGGPLTALGVAVEEEPTHIAGLPVAVSISCWADRKAVVNFGGVDVS